MSGIVGVCSWSLRPGSPEELVEAVGATGCRAVQLALEPIRRGAWDEDETFSRLADAGIAVASGMMEMAGEDYSSIDAIARTGGVRPDATWPENAEAAVSLAALADRHGIGLVTFHAGFLPHDAVDPERGTMLGRLSELARIFADAGVSIGLETGQEDAAALSGVLDEIERTAGHRVGVNFDPANMLLYGSGDPIEAVELLAPRVAQVHIKDAVPSNSIGRWGEEVVVGTGSVDWDVFFAVLDRVVPGVDLMIEREAGETRVSDIAVALGFVEAARGGGRS